MIDLKDIKIKKISQILFQDKAVETYRKALENDAQVFLFHGPSGCGKTTLAKFHAYKFGYNEEYDSLQDSVIVNCANNGSVSEIRELIENFSIYPIFDKRRVIVLDEAQILSKQAQTALMIPLEELPEFTDIIICCMDFGKLIDALVSRAANVEFKPFSFNDFEELIKRNHEYIKGKDDKFLLKCFRKSMGNFRAFLKFLENGIDYDNDDQEKIFNTLKSIVDWDYRRIENYVIEDIQNFVFKILDVLVDVLKYHEGEKVENEFLGRIIKFLDKKMAYKVHKNILEYFNRTVISYPNAYMSFVFFVRGEIYV